jgi:hypothetical protein
MDAGSELIGAWYFEVQRRFFGHFLSEV